MLDEHCRSNYHAFVLQQMTTTHSSGRSSPSMRPVRVCMLPMFTDDACCMAAARENEMCHARPCFLIKAPSPLHLIKGTVAEPHKQLLACMSSHLFDCLRVFCSLFCHLRSLIYYLCLRLLEIPRCLNSSPSPRASVHLRASALARLCPPSARPCVSPPHVHTTLHTSI